MSKTTTLFAGNQSRSLLPRGLVKAYHLSGVKVVEEPDQTTYKQLFPQAKYPSLVGPENYKLHEVIAVLLYLVSLNKQDLGPLMGVSELDSFQVMKWLSWGTTELVSAYKPANFIAKKKIPYDEAIFGQSQADVDFQVGYLEENLKGRKYLVGDSITMADLFIASLFNRPFQYLKGKTWRSEHPVLMKWFQGVITHPVLSWYDFQLADEAWAPTPL